MYLSSKLLEQIEINTRPKIEEHMLIVMDKSTHEELLYQPLQTNNKQFKVAITFQSANNGIFNVENRNNKFHFRKSLAEEVFIQIRIPNGAYEIESLNNEIKRNNIDEEHYTEANYSFKIRANFSTLGSIVEVQPQGPMISFVLNNSNGKLLGFNETILYKEFNSSPDTVDKLSIDNIFIHTDKAQGTLFGGRRSGLVHNFTKDVDPGYKYIEKFRGGVQWYMMESKDVISNISFKLKNENNQLVSFNSQSVTFRLSIKEI